MDNELSDLMSTMTGLGDPIGFYDTIKHALDKSDFSIDEQMLSYLMCGQFAITSDGSIYRARHLAGKIGKIRISVNSNEHPPPHFHVNGPNLDACFAIATCELIRGTISSRDLAAIRAWYKVSRKKVVRLWNETRPFGCPVGPIQE